MWEEMLKYSNIWNVIHAQTARWNILGLLEYTLYTVNCKNLSGLGIINNQIFVHILVIINFQSSSVSALSMINLKFHIWAMAIPFIGLFSRDLDMEIKGKIRLREPELRKNRMKIFNQVFYCHVSMIYTFDVSLLTNKYRFSIGLEVKPLCKAVIVKE